MTDHTHSPELQHSQLGKPTEYKNQYDASLLFAISRQPNRDEIGVDQHQPLPFYGEDTWTGYELSWLNPKGKPQVAVAEFVFPCQSSHIIESKSFKLYLNSFNQSQFASLAHVQQTLQADLSRAAHCEVSVTLYTPQQFNCFIPTELPGICLDEQDISIDTYQLDKNLLKANSNSEQVSETLHSHLLKSNCLITSQPDWASVIIRYQGQAICHQSLLRYLVSFRAHNEFHEQCVERIYTDLMQKFALQKLEVYARYTRRGGLDINPYRSSEQNNTAFKVRINRQ